MKTETIFYLVGGLFGLAAIVYFTWEYFLSFSKGVKVAMLICLVIAFFFLGMILRQRDR